ncbi:NB-ARC domain-containing protein [Actinomadura sp. BRA 177]|uniref:ATP-binding protein n=1 Tax=Actinomadura sp. BRA 177 TaxID=2745202 RepID=UPI001595B47D|nr:NB-ARC domain-containing protein [Actinomadura sp. BRA 177]NVI89033.1 regulator [Actinomadura sp. BRA 177]
MAGADVLRRGNLIQPSTALVGRHAELAELRGLFGTGRMVTVTGVGGVGKTRVALEAARELADLFCDGAWVVPLSGLRDGSLVGHAIARTLRVVDQTARPQLDVLADHLSGRRLLLVLDTCEHLRDACAGVVEVLLKAAPGLRVLSTSRQALGVNGERVLKLAPLETADTVSRPAAVTLFEERAAAATGGFAVSDDNWRTVVRLCHRLEGLPLALELAAGQLRRLSLEQLSDRLDDRFEMLVDGTADVSQDVSRHDALRTTVGWSHELCTRQERLLWARLSVFAGDFDQRAVEHVCSDDVLPADRVPGTLAGLVDKSILSRTGDGADVRYRLLDTLREYGSEWLGELGEQQNVRGRHRDWYLRLVEQCEREWFGAGQKEIFTRLLSEHANVSAALDYCLTTPGEAQTGLRMAGALCFYWVGCGFLAEGRYWLDRALALDADVTRVRAKALWVNGYIAIKQGETDAATAYLEAGRAAALQIGDPVASANAVHRLGCVALVTDDHAQAATLFKDALAAYDSLGEMNTSVIMARAEYAMTVAFQGDLPFAVELCEEVRAIGEEYGEQWVRAYALYVLAFAAWTGGRVEEATDLARQCVNISRTFHDLVCAVLGIELLALFHAAGGRPRDAAALQGAAGRIWRTVGLPLFGSAYFNAPHNEGEALARQALGDETYGHFFEQGTGLDLDQAVAFAMGERPSALPLTEAADRRR